MAKNSSMTTRSSPDPIPPRGGSASTHRPLSPLPSDLTPPHEARTDWLSPPSPPLPHSLGAPVEATSPALPPSPRESNQCEASAPSLSPPRANIPAPAAFRPQSDSLPPSSTPSLAGTAVPALPPRHAYAAQRVEALPSAEHDAVQRHSELDLARRRLVSRLWFEISTLYKGLSDSSGEWLDVNVPRLLREALLRCCAVPVSCTGPGCQQHALLVQSCNRRKYCPLCNQRAALQKAARLAAAIRDPAQLRLVTLTLGPCRLGGLAPSLDRLLKAFRRLRNRAVFRNIRGGLRVVHVVPKPDGYHVHVHLVVDGWIENRSALGSPLETEWASLTAWSSDQERRSVTIRRCETPEEVRGALIYVLSGFPLDLAYASWPAHFPAFSEIITTLHRRKLAVTWGTLRHPLPRRVGSAIARRSSRLCPSQSSAPRCRRCGTVVVPRRCEDLPLSVSLPTSCPPPPASKPSPLLSSLPKEKLCDS